MAKNPTSMPTNAVGNIARACTQSTTTIAMRKANDSATAMKPCTIDRRLPVPATTAARSGRKPTAPMSIPMGKANGSTKLIDGNVRPFRP